MDICKTSLIYQEYSNFPIIPPHDDDHGSLLWGWKFVSTFFEKAISIYDVLVSLSFGYVNKSSIFNNIWKAYLLWEKLVSSLPTNPHAILFSVWRTTLSHSYLDDSFPFFAPGAFGIVTTAWEILSWPLRGITFDIVLKAIFLDRSFLSWYKSSVWCPFILWNLHHLQDSGPTMSAFGEGGVGMSCKWKTSCYICSRRVLKGVKLSTTFPLCLNIVLSLTDEV